MTERVAGEAVQAEAFAHRQVHTLGQLALLLPVVPFRQALQRFGRQCGGSGRQLDQITHQLANRAGERLRHAGHAVFESFDQPQLLAHDCQRGSALRVQGLRLGVGSDPALVAFAQVADKGFFVRL